MDWLIIGLLLINIVLVFLLLYRRRQADTTHELKRLSEEMQRSFERIEKNFREDFRLNPEELESSFIAWTRSVAELTGNEVISIDGKSMRGTCEYGSSRRKKQ